MKAGKRYHGEEEAKLGVHLHGVPVGEDKVLAAFLLAAQHDGDLLRRHGQHRQVDAVELVEAAPRPRLGEAWRRQRALLGFCCPQFSCVE